MEIQLPEKIQFHVQQEWTAFIHKGYYITIKDKTFKIIEEYLPGKFKTRRVSSCNQYTGKRNEYGDKLYTPFEDDAAALERAKKYIDDHIHPWIESPHYKPKKL